MQRWKNREIKGKCEWRSQHIYYLHTKVDWTRKYYIEITKIPRNSCSPKNDKNNTVDKADKSMSIPVTNINDKGTEYKNP